jgi:curved DNA-binding protein CbpA
MSSERPISDDDVELTPEHRARILAVHRELRGMNLYDLLGVPRAADKKAIKRAYFDRTNEFHPDRFFRKRLGSYKPKMEMIFARLTEAHDILCNPDRRAQYDAALRVNRFSAIEEMLAQAAAEMEGAEHAALRENAIDLEHIRVDSSVPPPPAFVSQPPLAHGSQPPFAHTSSEPPRTQSGTRPAALPADAQARRDALARRLLGGVRSPKR